nr:DJ-1/PfpI family protein [Kibdelosporangium sp. MJ126-NF4]CEL17812.1 ThiJ/PfpI family protein [Kibdelosporangium sp. MJ126-NF4]CTQ90964.1 ThiJ/PfpI family protein [Kibdelosporangium sp. MJ126-NF4]
MGSDEHWIVEHTDETTAAPHWVWRRYVDVASWPEWNAGVARVRLTGPFQTGTTGELTPPGQGPLPFRIVSADENSGYVSQTDIADTVGLRTSVTLTALPGGGTRISSTAELVGPAARYFAESFGPALRDGLPRTVRALADIAALDAGRPAALIVLTSQDKLGDTGRSTGAYASEVADAWRVFTKAGYRIDVVSVRGGVAPLEAVDGHREFLEDTVVSARLDATATPGAVDPTQYAVVFFAGGHGAVWDFPDDKDLAEMTARCYDNGAVVAAVCHGGAALINVVGADGTPVIAGKRLAAFTNDEERAVGMIDIVPFLLADALVKRGAVHESAPSFLPHVVIDGRLVTGQNPASATGVAEAAVAAATR